MPSDVAHDHYTGRCYCGALSISATVDPLTVAYCHCVDCRRWTGSPLPAFAAFPADSVELPTGTPLEHVPGVQRWICHRCGSPMAARFDYLPGQIYIPVGILDQAGELEPKLHCHSESQLNWLHLGDDLPRASASGRDMLNASGA